MAVGLLFCIGVPRLQADPPPATKARYTIGSVVRLIAVSRTKLYYLLLMQEKYSDGDSPMAVSKRLSLASKGSVKGKVATAACIVVVDKARALKSARAANAQVSTGVSSDLVAGRVRADVATRLRANLMADLASSVRVVAVDNAQLQRLLGSPAMVTGRLAMVSDLAGDIVGTISGLSGIATTEIAAPGFAAVGFNTLLGAGTAAEIAASVPMVTAAAAAGYATGTAMNGIYTAALSAATGKSNYTIGDAIYDVFVGDDDTPNPPAAESSTTGQTPPATTTPAPATTTPASTTTTPSTTPSDPPAATDNDGSGTDESSSDDDSDDDSSDDDNSGDGDAGTAQGTALPPDMQNGSPIGTLVMYVATGLGRSEMQRQLAAIDIAGGGSLGAERRRMTDLHWDQMLGGFYLNTILRGVEARRNKQGQREPISTYIQMPDKRMFINGAVCPPPRIDYIQAAVAVVGK